MLTKIFGFSGIKDEISELKQEISDLKITEQGFLEVIECIKKTNEELYEKFKYNRWSDLNPLLRKYLAQRFGFNFASIFCIHFENRIFLNETVGGSCDRYNVLESTKDKKPKKKRKN